MPASATRRVAVSTFYQALGKVLGIGFGVLAFSFTSRALGPELFGALTTAVTFASIFATLADLGLPILLLRILAFRRASDAARVENLHTIRVVSTLLIMAACIGIARLFPYDADVQRGIMIVSLGYIAVSYTQYIVAIFQEKLRTGRAALAEIVGRGVMFAVVAAATYLGWSFDAFLWASTVGSAAAFLLSYVLSLRFWKPHLRWQFATWPSLLALALPLVLLTAFQIVYFKIDTLLLSLLAGNAAVGIYSAAYKFMDVFITFPALFSTLVMPFVARALQNRSELHRIYVKALRAVLIVAVPLTIVTAIEGARLVELLSGAEFTDSGPVLQALAIAVVPLFVGNLSTTTMIGLGKASAVAWLFGSTAVGGTVLYCIAVSMYGYWGAAIGTILVESFVAAISLAYVLRRIPTLPLKPILSIAGAGAGCLGVALLARPLPIIGALSATIVAYGALLLVLRTVSLPEIRSVTARTYRA